MNNEIKTNNSPLGKGRKEEGFSPINKLINQKSDYISCLAHATAELDTAKDEGATLRVERIQSRIAYFKNQLKLLTAEIDRLEKLSRLNNDERLNLRMIPANKFSFPLTKSKMKPKALGARGISSPLLRSERSGDEALALGDTEGCNTAEYQQKVDEAWEEVMNTPTTEIVKLLTGVPK